LVCLLVGWSWFVGLFVVWLVGWLWLAAHITFAAWDQQSRALEWNKNIGAVEWQLASQCKFAVFLFCGSNSRM
jgi:hypothetical protein